MDPSLDCNGDGVLDICQLAEGGDCDGNGVLDECQSPDCDNDGVADHCEDDDNRNGIPDDCEEEWRCPTVVQFEPDPETHADPSSLVILTGDREIVSVSWPADEPIRLVILDPSVAQFTIEDEFLNEVQPTGPPPEDFKVAGRRAGQTKIEARRLSNGEVLGCLDVLVGGTMRIEYDGLPTFNVLPTANPAGGFPPTGPSGGPANPPIVLGGSALGSGAPDARSPVDPALVLYIAHHVQDFITSFRVELIGPDGQPKKGRLVAVVSRDNVVRGFPIDIRHDRLTDERGRAYVNLHASPTLQNDLGLSSEHPIVPDNVAVLFGETAERYYDELITAPEIDAQRTPRLISDHVNTGHSLRYTENLAAAGTTAVEAIATVDMAAVNKVAYAILRQALQADVYDGTTIENVSLPYYDVKTESWLNVSIGQDIGALDDMSALSGAIYPDLSARPNYEIEPIDPNDPPPGGGSRIIAATAIIAELGVGMIPVAGDLIEAGRELFSYWLGYSEQIDYLNLALCAVGLLADGGYLAGPVGVIGNLGVAAVRAVLKLLGPELAEVILRFGPSALDALKAFMFDYVSKIPIPQEGSFIERASVFAGGLLGRVKAVVDEVWEITKDHVDKVLKWVAGCPGMLSEQAHAGFGLIVKLFDEANPEVLATLKAAIPTEALVDSLESIGSAFGRSRSRVTPTMQGAAAETALLRDAINAATQGPLSGPPGLRAALESAAVGAGKPFKSKQELEACLRMHGDDLTPEQVGAIRDARLSLFSGAAKPAIDTMMSRVTSVSKSHAMLMRNEQQIQGFLTTSDSVAGLATSESVIHRLRLDGPPGISPTDGYARIDFPLDGPSREKLKVPMGRGHFVGPDGDVMLYTGNPPFTGTGVTAATDGFLCPEFNSVDPLSLPVGSKVSFKGADGGAMVVQVRVGGVPRSSAFWVLKEENGVRFWDVTDAY